MNPADPVDWTAYVDAASAAIGLPIDPAHRAAVVANLVRMAQVAGVVDTVPLTDTDEAAAVYRP
jgi:hypothetical protein